MARLLIKAGARVIPLMTKSAEQFIGAMTLSGICGAPVRTEMFDPSFPGEAHVQIANEADVVVIVPATADLLARLASGRADDLVTALALCTEKPVIAAPSMHPRMWSHPAVQANVATLMSQGRVELVGPVDGEVASGDSGIGRMAEPAQIAAVALSHVGKRDLEGLHVVVTAGPTVEDIDPVRFLGNRSTGKMGFAVAERAASRGALVTLIAGPVSLPTPLGVQRIDVRGTLAMQSALWQTIGLDLKLADALVMTAAVADYRPAEEHAMKLKRTKDTMAVELVPNPDLLAEIGAARRQARPVLVGFAVETGPDAEVVAYAKGKLASKRVDMIVANNARESFGRDDNRVTLVDDQGTEELGTMSKLGVADRILDRIAARCGR
ncbi:Phosphopantothenoylcysteine decarboxylase [Minicystis rosea]|nr:Phosphopantothenoylcysteine decarboxylase [Minicystis rosea]